MGVSFKMLNINSRRLGLLLSMLVAGVTWFEVIRIVQNDWRIDPQYSYGLLVPFLVIGLLMKRREDCPASEPLGVRIRLVTGIVLVAASLLLAAIVPEAEANPDWRLLGGVAALAAVAITLCLIIFRGGKVWLTHYAFAVGFFLIAVPWPRNFEQSVMSYLMSWNTATTVEILHWCGYEALRQGNLIVIPSGILGIEEACSGIRSLQSGLMVALFFGEIFRLTIARRLGLLFLAFIAALAGNIMRSSFLAILASRQGLGSVPAWHDPAGFIVLLVSILTVFGIAFLWRSQSRLSELPGGMRRNIHPVSPGNPPAALLAAVLLLLVVPIILTEVWFRMHDLPSGSNWKWSIHQRSQGAGVSEVPLSPATLRMLFYPQGFSEKWIGAGGEMGQVFVLQWPAGRAALQSVQMHSPEVCLASMGMHLEKPLADFEIGSGVGVGVRLHSWLFSQQGHPIYVFHSILEQGGGVGESTATYQSPMERLENPKLGKRNRGQRMIEVAFWNLNDESEARAALVRYLKESLTMTTAPFPNLPKKSHE